jgi:superkiller protein 3
MDSWWPLALGPCARSLAIAWYNLGVAYGKKGESGKEFAAYKKATDLNPSLSEAWYNLGVIFSGRGQYGEAIRAYKKATDIDPSDPAVWYNLGLAYTKRGQYDGAIKAFAKAIMFCPACVLRSRGDMILRARRPAAHCHR